MSMSRLAGASGRAGSVHMSMRRTRSRRSVKDDFVMVVRLVQLAVLTEVHVGGEVGEAVLEAL